MVTLRASLLIVSLSFLAALALHQPGRGAPESLPAAAESLSLPVDHSAPRKLDAAAEYLKARSWADAVRLLQAVLDAPADTFVPGHQGSRWLSARAEAERLLGSLPPPGLEFYQVQFGPTAKARLEEARRTGDPRLLEEVARRYLYTTAGADALELLATYHLDRGRYAAAAAYFARLLGRRPAEQLSEAVLLRAALAFRLAGDRALADRLWKRLEARAGTEGLRLGERTVRLADLRREIEQRADRAPADGEWRVFRGDGRRQARADGDLPLLEPRWQAETAGRDETRSLLRQAVTFQEEEQQPVLPGACPVAVADTLVYRTYGGICAADRQSGRERWRYRMPLSLDACMADPGKKVSVRAWLPLYSPTANESPDEVRTIALGGMRAFIPWTLSGHPGGPPAIPSLLYENTALGTLSADSSRVYAVEDLAVPPHPSQLEGPQQEVRRPLGPLGRALHYNRLVAVDLETGRVAWRLGGRGKGEWQDSYFVGPPLPLSGKLYALAEKQGEIVLACLDAARGDTAWAQPLAIVRHNLVTDVGRRLQAVHLACEDSVLVCPTNAGFLVGIDLLTHNLLWAHEYRAARRDPGEAETFPLVNGPDWKASAPIIQDGKVVFTAADDDSVHCIRLRDGAPLWKAPGTADDLYLGAVGRGKVLLIGKAACRAVSLAYGSPLWSVTTEMPSGQGVLSGGRYYLPLHKGAVCAIDLDRGQVVGSAEVRGGVPGNLLFHRGDLLSQSVTAVAAYPQLRARLAEVEGRLARDPQDPAALAERGKLRLCQDDLPAAIADLRRALAGTLPAAARPKARDDLYRALTRLLDRDFAAGAAYMAEYRELCRVAVPADATPGQRREREREQQRRQLHLLCLLCRAREGQPGEPAAALSAYEDLYRRANDLLFPVPEDPAVRARLDVWARARVEALFSRADAAAARALRAEVARRWQAVRGAEDAESLGRFAGLFGSCTVEGREARLLLAEQRLRDRDNGCLLEAELDLLRLLEDTDDPPFRARVLEALARLCARGGLVEDALFYYRALARTYPTVAACDGKAGANFLRELALDKRFLPHLDGTRPAWSARRTRVVEDTGRPGPAPALVTLVPRGELTPSLRRHLFVLDLRASRLRLLRRDTGVETWGETVPLEGLCGQLAQAGFPGTCVACPVVGHLMIVNLGAVAFAVDMLDRRVLWRRPLTAGPLVPSRMVVSPLDGEGPPGFMPQREGQVQLLAVDRLGLGEQRVLARPGPVSAGRAVVQTAAGLEALDPLRGGTLWVRGDVAADAVSFGDARALYLVEQSGACRGLRAQDGMALRDVPNFTSRYGSAVAVRGGTLLASSGWFARVLVLYDVRSGRTLCKLTAPLGSQVLLSPDPDLAGLLAPDGKLQVADLRARRAVLSASLDRRHLANLQQGYLLADADNFYVVLCRAPEPNQPELSDWPALSGMPYLPVNGTVYAIDRATGAVRWYLDVRRQTLLLDQFEDLPLLVFAVGVDRQEGGKTRQSVRVLSIDKRTGKRLYQAEFRNESHPFHALRMTGPDGPTVLGRAGKPLRLDPAASVIELVGPTRRIRHVQIADGD
jgi:outer membrane protein assembly factor BamB/tetratricopeptide (TPR) repeat protein